MTACRVTTGSQTRARSCSQCGEALGTFTLGRGEQEPTCAGMLGFFTVDADIERAVVRELLAA